MHRGIYATESKLKKLYVPCFSLMNILTIITRAVKAVYSKLRLYNLKV